MAMRVYSCRRCGGMMVETYADLLSPSQTGEAVVWWRCVNCGEYVDRQMLLNRFVQEQVTHLPPGLIRQRSCARRTRSLQAYRRAAAA